MARCPQLLGRSKPRPRSPLWEIRGLEAEGGSIPAEVSPRLVSRVRLVSGPCPPAPRCGEGFWPGAILTMLMLLPLVLAPLNTGVRSLDSTSRTAQAEQVAGLAPSRSLVHPVCC